MSVALLMAGASLLQGISGYNQGKYNAAAARREAAFQAREIRRKGKYYIGAITASAGKSGVTGSSGSVVDAIGQSAANNEFDALVAKHNGEVKAVAAKRQGRAALLKGILGAGTSAAGSSLFSGGAGGGSFGDGVVSGGTGGNNYKNLLRVQH